MPRQGKTVLGNSIYEKPVRPPPGFIEAIVEIYEPEDLDGAISVMALRVRMHDELQRFVIGADYTDAEDGLKHAGENARRFFRRLLAGMRANKASRRRRGASHRRPGKDEASGARSGA